MLSKNIICNLSLKIKPTFCILAFLCTTVGASTTEVFRYSDSKGRAVFTDRPLGGSQYRLIWRASLARLDAQFERTPHLPINTIADNKPSSSVGVKISSKKSGGGRVHRRKSEFTPMIQRIAKKSARRMLPYC